MNENKVSKILPVVILGLLSLLLALFLLKVPSVSSVSVASSIDAVLDGSYQTSISTWISDNIYGQNFLHKVYNQLKYSLLHEGADDWIIGKDGWIYSDSQSLFEISSGRSPSASYDQYLEYADKIKQVQDALESKGKSFCLLLDSAKAAICPEYLPSNYQFIAEKYSSVDLLTDGDLLKQALDARGVHYYDATALLKELNEAGEITVFHRTGHHWTIAAASMAVNAMFDVMRQDYPDKTFPQIQIVGKTNDLFSVDTDIYDLQNIFSGKKDQNYDTPVIQYKDPSAENMFLFGTSFGYEVLQALYRNEGNRAFDTLAVYQYFTARNIGDNDGLRTDSFREEQPTSDRQIMNEIRDSDIVIMEQQMLGIPSTHVQWLDYVAANLDSVYYTLGTNVACATPDQTLVEYGNFYAVEDWGRWSKGTDSSVTLYSQNTLAPKAAKVQLRISARACNFSNCCMVSVNGHKIGTMEIDTEMKEFVLPIPSEYLKQKENEISFLLENRFQTIYELNASGDNRSLGVGIGYLAIEEVS